MTKGPENYDLSVFGDLKAPAISPENADSPEKKPEILDEYVYTVPEPTDTFYEYRKRQGAEGFKSSEGFKSGFVSNRDVGRAHIQSAFGGQYINEEFVEEPADLIAGFKLGWAQTPEKEKEIVEDLYGPQAEIRHYDLGEWGKHTLLSKDGENWKNVSSAWDWQQAAPETAASVAFGPQRVGYSLLRAGQAALAGFSGKLAVEYPLGQWWEDGRESPWVAATRAGIAEGVGQSVSDYLLQPFLMRIGAMKPDADALAARKAADEEKLQPVTRGQASNIEAVQRLYKQVQAFPGKSRRLAHERFLSLKDGLDDWVEDLSPDLGDFTKAQLEALYEVSSRRISGLIAGVRGAKTPISLIGPTIEKAVETFSRASRALRNSTYDDAFAIAASDNIHFNTAGLKQGIAQLRRGVPVLQEPVTKTTTSMGNKPVGYGQAKPVTTATTATPPPDRLLTPSEELESIFKHIDTMATVLRKHSPDGSEVSSLEQLNALRRELSDYAWKHSDTNPNQSRLATDALNMLDGVMANPVGAPSKAYLTKFEEAQSMHGVWRIAMDLKKTASLRNADTSTYQRYVEGLFRPGNGPYLEVVEEMLSGTPGAFDALRRGFVSNMLRDPKNIGKAIENFKHSDPVLLNKLLPNKADVDVLVEYGAQKAEFDKSWITAAKNADYLTVQEAAEDIFKHGPEKIRENVNTFIKFSPDPDEARRKLQASFLHSVIEQTKTTGDRLLPNAESIVDANAFEQLLAQNDHIVKALFDEKGQKRLANFSNYAMVIKDTGTALPGRVAQTGGTGGDGATGLVVAQAMGTIRSLPADIASDVKNKGAGGAITGAAGKLFRILGGPPALAFMMGLNKPLASETKKGAGFITEKGMTAIHNFNRIMPALMAHNAQELPNGAGDPYVHVLEDLKYGP